MFYLILAVLILLFLVYLFFNKRKEEPPIQPQQTESYKNLLQQHVAFYRQLDPEQQESFVSRVGSFLQETHLEGVGFELEDLDRILVAASALIPIFRFKDWRYPHLTNVILYPDTFNNDFQFEGGKREMAGLVGGGFMNGQMLLSRAALRKGFSASAGAENTGIHEFVHLLDQEDGATDGMPEHLLPPEYAEPWMRLMHQEIKKMENGKSDINPYAMTNEAEFFAVVSEYFFGEPEKLKKKHPELYEMLDKIFSEETV